MTHFGTDGVRGRANVSPMDPETILSLALASASVFSQGRRDKHRPRVVIGKDTRLSGYMIEPALTAGFIAQGFDVTLLGPLPTPAIALLTRSLRADLGVMITASHNPYHDNGIKFFDGEGNKISNAQEAQISQLSSAKNWTHAAPDDMGKAVRMDDAHGRYVEFVKGTLQKGSRLDGLRIVVDTANGVCYKVAPEIFWELGAEVYPLHHKPDGYNINDGCGALHPAAMAEKMRAVDAHIGIALDGDGDRVIIVDEKGQAVDGDRILAMLAVSLKEKGALSGDSVVSTVMSNMGFEAYLAEQDIQLHRANVGDRHVAAMMRDTSSVIGGEQSGHIILSQQTTTGDGLVAALQVLEILVKKGCPLSEIAHPFTSFPQKLTSYPFMKNPLEEEQGNAFFEQVSARLGKKGRLLIRKSGTENLIRVMVEAETDPLVQEVAQEVELFLKVEGYIADLVNVD